MELSFTIPFFKKDRAWSFAQKYEILKKELSTIDATLDGYTIKYDDKITRGVDIQNIINRILNIKF